MADLHQPRPSEQRKPGPAQAPPTEPPSLTGVDIARACVANRAEFETRCGQRVNPRAFEIEPQGNRMLVVVDPVPDRIGQIELPDSVKAVEAMGQGWVLSAGPMAGIDIPYPGGPICTPDMLVGRHIFFGAYLGKVLRFSLFDREYQGRVHVLTDRDVWCVDWNPDPRAAEQQFEDDLAAHLERVQADRQRQEDEAAERLVQQRREAGRAKW
jgi:hypothetical protein